MNVIALKTVQRNEITRANKLCRDPIDFLGQ
jgi:hypothetical protein